MPSNFFSAINGDGILVTINAQQIKFISDYSDGYTYVHFSESHRLILNVNQKEVIGLIENCTAN